MRRDDKQQGGKQQGGKQQGGEQGPNGPWPGAAPTSARHLQRDDSRLLDDELAPADKARVAREASDDLPRARAAAKTRAALDLWACDARGAAPASDPAAIRRGVFARIAADPDGRTYAPPQASWSWVAAAAALLAIGVGGLWSSWPGRSAAPQIPGVVRDLESDSLALLRHVEIEALAVASEGR